MRVDSDAQGGTYSNRAPATRLRELVNENDILPVPLVYDALSARVADACGFEAILLSGYAFSACYLGLPDAGFTSSTELLLAARNVVAAAKVPVIVDIDTGFGNALSLKRMVQEFAQIGVAGVLFEDQVAPKRSEFVAGVQVVSLDEARGKVQAAADARAATARDLMLIARTDARTTAGGTIGESIRRGNAYLDAGADVIFVAAPQSIDEIKTAMRELHGPAFAPVSGLRPHPPLSHQQEWGMAMTFNGGAHRVAAAAVWDYFQAIRSGESAQEEFAERLRGHPLEDFHRFIGFGDLQQEEIRYLPENDLRKRYEGSIGFRDGPMSDTASRKSDH